MKKTSFLMIIFAFVFMAFRAVVGGGIRPIAECSVMPNIIVQQGFLSNQAFFSTSEQKIMGIVCMDSKTGRTYQHPSWTSAGRLAPLVIDKKGDVWAAPAPMINTLDNPTEKQNTLYRIDGKTGQMQAVLSLPYPILPTSQNPFGLLGLGYDCETTNLFATTVMASDRNNERGRIFSLNTQNPQKVTIIDSLKNIDAMGCGLAYMAEEKRLFFGKARTPEIYSVAITNEGKFIGEPRLELSLSDLGPRGDDRARKIRFNTQGQMVIQGISFYFNLTAPTEKQETVYLFRYDAMRQRWLLEGVQAK